MKKILALLLSALLLLGLLAACGTPAAEESAPPSGEESAAPASEAPAPAEEREAEPARSEGEENDGTLAL